MTIQPASDRSFSESSRPHGRRGGDDAAQPDGAADALVAAARSRRAFLLAGLGVMLGGCASSGRVHRTLPGPIWGARGAGSGVHAVPVPEPAITSGATLAGGPISGIIPRSQWALEGPIASRINPMGSIRRITIHHDAVPIYDGSASFVSARLESFRRNHVTQRTPAFGDIGYHYIIDPGGRVWEGRSIASQGAHVGGQNEGNVGVMLMGNFEQQQPTHMQIAKMHELVSALARRHRVHAGEIRTHREFDRSNLCPGAALHARVVQSRAAGRLS